MKKTKTVFKHVRNTENIGDASCCPVDYFPFENSVALDLNEKTPKCNAVIYGGGKIFGGLYKEMERNDRDAKHRIAWGVGTTQSNPFSPNYYFSRRAMSLIGSRDYGDKRYEYAPCVSCMSNLFDQGYEETNEIVFYYHESKTEKMGITISDNILKLSNNCRSMREAIEFIGSGHTVVSNSYHGVYWGLLLGKNVLCVPFSGKFSNYRIDPGYASAKNWQENIGSAKRSDEMLSICRQATQRFYEKVCDRIQ